MKKFGPLTPLLSRRSLLLSGLTLALLANKPLRAKEVSGIAPARRSASLTDSPTKGGKRIVMIDPGHGGIDSGAVGEEGSEEKHVVLEIANHIRHLLSNHQHIEARLTRETDHFIPLGERVEIAHQHGASLFMSIHADGFTSPEPTAHRYLRFPTGVPAAAWPAICHNAKMQQMMSVG